MAQILLRLVVLPSPLFVEGQDDHGHPLILCHVANVLMHGRQRRDCRCGPDNNSAQLVVGMECPSYSVLPVAAANAIEERKAIPPSTLDHDNGRRSFSELHEMHDEELHKGLVGAPGGLDEANEGGYVSRAMDAGENAELVHGVGGGGQVTQLPVSAGGDATSWFVDGHDCRSCDEGGKERHEN
jgi:hypothetical protein